MKFGNTLLVIFLMAGIAIALMFLPFREGFSQLEAYVQSLGAAALLAVALVHVAARGRVLSADFETFRPTRDRRCGRDGHRFDGKGGGGAFNG